MISRARVRAHAEEVRPTAAPKRDSRSSKDPHLAKATLPLWGGRQHTRSAIAPI